MFTFFYGKIINYLLLGTHILSNEGEITIRRSNRISISILGCLLKLNLQGNYIRNKIKWISENCFAQHWICFLTMNVFRFLSKSYYFSDVRLIRVIYFYKSRLNWSIKNKFQVNCLLRHLKMLLKLWNLIATVLSLERIYGNFCPRQGQTKTCLSHEYRSNKFVCVFY